jgi:hypothetical protein
MDYEVTIKGTQGISGLLRPAKLSVAGSPHFDGFLAASVEALPRLGWDGHGQHDLRWNGWELPYFTFDQAQAIIEWQNIIREDLPPAHYHAPTDTFCIFMGYQSNDPNEMDNWYTVKGIWIGDVKFYPVVYGSWCWDEVTNSE